jgi:hypothetical protein
MYDPTLSSDCKAARCPYTSYKPYFEYYCSSATSPCNGDGGYANTIITAALEKTNAAATLTNGGMDFTSVADSARVEMIKKGTAYMSAWMYAIREFEDAIDDCTSGSLTANAGSSGPVHAWDEGVAFYVGSAMSLDDLAGTATGNTLAALDDKGFLAYTLANKRCKNFKTCGPNGNAVVGEAKVNIDLWNLFTAGNRLLLVGKCTEVEPVVTDIVKKMTVPLIQGTLRYAYKQATTAASAKAKGEGAIFAAGVLPKVHACSPAAAKTIYDNMNVNNAGTVDHAAVKAAFEQCYSAMGVTCADVGGLWDTTTSAYMSANGLAATPSLPNSNYDASPCVDPAPKKTLAPGSSDDKMPDYAVVLIAVLGALFGLFFIGCLYVIMQEKAGKPIFTAINAGGPAHTPKVPASAV